MIHRMIDEKVGYSWLCLLCSLQAGGSPKRNDLNKLVQSCVQRVDFHVCLYLEKPKPKKMMVFSKTVVFAIPPFR